MECIYCKEPAIKKGFQSGRQKYLCKRCGKHFQDEYTYKRCTPEDENMIIKLNNEGLGINGISRITKVSKANVINHIKTIASRIEKPTFNEAQKHYEADEMYAFIKRKESPCYLIYAINKITKKVIDFTLGSRSKENLGKIIKTLTLLNPKKISTDKLNIYPSLIEKSIHSIKYSGINHIERLHLTLRTHLKRLSRKTICFSKSITMLESCLKIYLWG